MKREYVKPNLSFESFEMSSNIATGCGNAQHYSEMTCDTQLGAGMVYFVDNNSCEYTPEDNGMCYQIPTEDTRLFAS